MGKMSPMEIKVRKEARAYLKQKAMAMRRQALKHAYDNPRRHNELVNEARYMDVVANLVIGGGDTE